MPAQDAPNLVYTLVPLEHLAAIEKEIKHCLLELVKVEAQPLGNLHQKSSDSLAENSTQKKTFD